MSNKPDFVLFSDVREMEANRGDVRMNVRYVSVNVGEEEANRGDVRVVSTM